MRKAVCVLCGHFGPVTREHAPPQCLFLKPKPTNMITVPTCSSCNGKTKLDDEYFRIYITGGAEEGSKLGRLWTEKVVNSSLRNSPALSRMLGKDRDIFVQEYEGKSVRSTTGRLVPEDERHLVQPMSVRRINGVVTKIVRCLHFHERKKRLPLTAGFTINTVPQLDEDYWMLRNFPTGRVGIEDEFLYLVQTFDVGVSRWLLSFYDKHMFDVIVSVPNAT